MHRSLIAVFFVTALLPGAVAEEVEMLPRGVSEERARQIEGFLQAAGRSQRYDLNELEELLGRWEELKAFASKGILDEAGAKKAAREFIHDALVTLEADYARASKALEEGVTATAADVFLGILEDDSPYAHLEAYASLGLGRALFDLDRHNEARLQLSQTLERGEPYLANLAEALFALARSYEAIGLRAAAEETYRRIVDELSDDCPPAILEVARRNTERPEPAADGENPLGEVITLMGRSEGRLREENTGSDTQRVQKKIVDLLDELIKKAEAAEQSSSGSAGGSQASAPASSASLPGGDGKPKNLRRVSEGDQEESWGNLPEREREEVIQTLKARYPARYKELIEQYFKDIQGSQ